MKETGKVSRTEQSAPPVAGPPAAPLEGGRRPSPGRGRTVYTVNGERTAGEGDGGRPALPCTSINIHSFLFSQRRCMENHVFRGAVEILYGDFHVFLPSIISSKRAMVSSLCITAYKPHADPRDHYSGDPTVWDTVHATLLRA